MTDLDGTYAYSQIASLRIDKSGQTPAIIYPNPASDILIVDNSDEIVLLRIISAEGKQVYETRKVPDTLPIKGLAKGIYQVHITKQSGEVEKQRIAIL